jgi:hypothetical protein
VLVIWVFLYFFRRFTTVKFIVFLWFKFHLKWCCCVVFLCFNCAPIWLRTFFSFYLLIATFFYSSLQRNILLKTTKIHLLSYNWTDVLTWFVSKMLLLIITRIQRTAELPNNLHLNWRCNVFPILVCTNFYFGECSFAILTFKIKVSQVSS